MIIKAFNFEKDKLVSVGEIEIGLNYLLIMNKDKKYKDITIIKKNRLKTSLSRGERYLSGYTGILFQLFKMNNDDICVSWHIFNWEEAKESGLTKEVVYELMGEELKDNLKELIKTL